MKKLNIRLIYALVLSALSFNVNAALINGSTLSIENFSYFDLFGQNVISGVDGIKLGTIQSNTFDYPNLSSIDNWTFIGASGMHYTTSPTNIISSMGNTAEIDFSGWSWAFNGGLVRLDLGGGAWGSNSEGVAQITCSVDCGDGDTYSLYYTATVSGSDLNGYAGQRYELMLSGTVSAVPVPAAFWLFVSGLIGMASFFKLGKK